MIIMGICGYIYLVSTERKERMDMRAMGDDFKVCLCKNRTKKEMVDLIREKEIKTLDELREIGDVGNKCGACCEDLEQLLTLAYE